jgi:hypothetical protein
MTGGTTGARDVPARSTSDRVAVWDADVLRTREKA